jgi:voltage-gated potassium channel
MKSSFLATGAVVRQLFYLIALIVTILTIGSAGFYVSGYEPTGAFFTAIEALAGKAQTAQPHGLVIGLNLFGAILIWFAIWTAFGLAVEGKFGEFLKESRMLSNIKKMNGHYIICGAGKVGSNIGRRLMEVGHKVVFIEKDKDAIHKLKSQSHNVIDVGTIDEHVLKEAGIERAAGIAIALGEDGKNLLLALTAKELNPKIKIAVRASDPKIVPKLKKAGADYILLPEALGGIKLADALSGKVDKSLVFVNDQRWLV